MLVTGTFPHIQLFKKQVSLKNVFFKRALLGSVCMKLYVFCALLWSMKCTAMTACTTCFLGHCCLPNLRNIY